jgi:PKD repeat protein
MKTICIYSDFISSFGQILKSYLINNQTFTKMKQAILKLSSLIVIFLIGSCQKADVKPQVKADFIYTISPSGRVTFTNTSTNADSFSWSMGDGTNRDDKTSFTHDFKSNKEFQVKLTATKEGVSDVAVKSVVINNLLGRLVVYKAFPTDLYKSTNIWVYVDGKYYGIVLGVTNFAANPPDCGSLDGVPIENLTEGKHQLKCQEVITNGYVWEREITIVAGACNKEALIR